MLRQGASRSITGGSEAGGELAATTPKTESITATSGLAQSKLLAIEKAAASTRTYALENLGDYRSTRVLGRGVGELKGRGGTAVDTTGIYIGGKNLPAASTLPEVGRLCIYLLINCC